MRGKKHLVVLMSVWGCLGATMAHASSIDVVCYTDTLENTYANFTKELSVPQFDPALGTLDFVRLQIALGQASTVKAELLNPESPGLYDYDLSWDITMTGLGGETLLQLMDTAGSSGALTSFDGLHDYDGTSGFTDLYANNHSDTRLFGSITPGFGSFIGTGSMPFVVEALATLSLTGTGSPFYLIHETGATAQVEVCYDYIPIPEPVSLAFFGAGGLIALRRRRV